MRLRVFDNFYSHDNKSTNFFDIACEGWEVTGNMLIIYLPGGNDDARYMPLMHVKSFMEVDIND